MSISKALDYPRIPCVYLNILIRTVAEWHITPEQLLLGSGLSLASLNDPEFRVEYLILAKLLLRAVQLTNEPGLGFYIGRQIKVSSLGLVGFTALVANTLREAFEIAGRFASLQIPRLNFRLEVEGKYAYVYWHPEWMDLRKDTDRLAYEIAALYCILACIEIIPVLCGQRVIPSRVDFIFKRPAYFDRFEPLMTQIMGDVHCDQPYTRMVFPVSVLDLPLVMADPVTAKLMREQCQQELDILFAQSNIVTQVRELIYSEKEGIRSMEAVSDELSLSKRTLQRLLKNVDQNFNSLYDEVRQQKALILVKRKDLCLDQIAEKLGYANSASFNRAFKRWTGETPGKYGRRD